MVNKIYDFRTVSARLKSEDFAEFKSYCDAKGVKPSKEIKDLIEKEVKNPLPINLAGKNQFIYNPAKDNFSWRAVLDKEVISYIKDDLSPEFLKQLKEAVDKAIEERNTFLQKEKEDSVAIPSKILRKGL